MAMLAERGEPLTFDEIAAELKLASEDQLEALRRRLKAMLRDGQLLRNRKTALHWSTKWTWWSGVSKDTATALGF